MSLTISFGRHLYPMDFDRLRPLFKSSTHHILENSLFPSIENSALNHFGPPRETYFLRSEKSELIRQKKAEHSFWSRRWKLAVKAATAGGLDSARFQGIAGNSGFYRLNLISKENKARLASGRDPIRIHMEPVNTAVFRHMVNAAVDRHNMFVSARNGDWEKFVRYARKNLVSSEKFDQARNRCILDLAKKLHEDPDVSVTSDLGGLHRPHFEKLAVGVPFPVNLKEDANFLLYPFDKLHREVAEGKNPNDISETKLAGAVLGSYFLNQFTFHPEMVD
ncbi:hypothetical protein HY994_05555 [Candidatus Micrarchaeota archaeon]|nr:hypothetical protein [Candidatus Micrarchaeota archaeon]